MIFESRALRFGLSWNLVRWPAGLGPALVAALAGVPVRMYRRGARLRHPREGTDPCAGIIGHVQAATATESEVLASLEIFDERLVSRLLALETRRLLARTVGLSILADVLYLPTIELGNAVRRVSRIRDVVALDCVSFPSADGCVLRSVVS